MVSKSNLLFYLQMLCILALIFHCGWLSQGPLISLQILAVVIAIWAFYQFPIRQFSVFPEPKKLGELIKSGPYRFIRHPMYTSLILYFLPLVILKADLWAYGLYLALLLSLIIKLHHEEELLKAHFDTYVDYCRGSKKLIPFIY